MAPLRLRNFAPWKTFRHRSMVVASSPPGDASIPFLVSVTSHILQVLTGIPRILAIVSPKIFVRLASGTSHASSMAS